MRYIPSYIAQIVKHTAIGCGTSSVEEYDHELRRLRSFSMTRHIIRTPDAPSSALYSQAIKAGSTVYVSGTVGVDPKTNQLAGSTIQEQTRQALANCESILPAAGAALPDGVEGR